MIRLCNASFLAAIVLGFAAVSFSHAAVFYVDPENGDMAGDGSAGRPWKTVQEVSPWRRKSILTACSALRERVSTSGLTS